MKIQVLLAAFCGEKYLSEQLDSLIQQQIPEGCTYSVLISDDMSTDQTPQIIEDYRQRYPEIIRVLPAKKSGSAKDNFLRLMRESDGDVVLFCDQDDWWLPEKVSRTVSAFSGKTGPVAVYSDAMIVDEDLRQVSVDEKRLQTHDHGLTLPHLLVQNYVMGCTLAVNRVLLDGALRDSYPGIEMHDWWLVIYAAAFGQIVHVPEKLMKYRQHGDNAVGAKDLSSGRYIRTHMNGRVLRENCGNLLKQAAGFYRCYGDMMDEGTRQVFTRFMTLRSHSKPVRILTQIRCGYLKSTFARVIGQLLYM